MPSGGHFYQGNGNIRNETIINKNLSRFSSTQIRKQAMNMVQTEANMASKVRGARGEGRRMEEREGEEEQNIKLL